MQCRPLVLLFLLLFVNVCFIHAASPTTHPFVITGYVFPRGAVLNPGQVDASRLTRINYAFSNIENGRMVAGSAADAQNFTLLRSLRNTTPNLTILVFVGGWRGAAGGAGGARARGGRAGGGGGGMQ